MTAVAKEKPKAERDRAGRKSAPVQIEKELARMAAVIAAHDGVTLSDLLTPVLRDAASKNLAQIAHEIADLAARSRDTREALSERPARQPAVDRWRAARAARTLRARLGGIRSRWAGRISHSSTFRTKGRD